MSKTDVSRLVLTLKCRDVVSDAEVEALASLPFKIRQFDANNEIIQQGQRVSDSCLILDGFCIRAHQVRSGSRQISAIHIPGDFVDLHGFFLKVLDHSIVALRTSTVAFVSHQAVRKLFDTEPHLARLLSTLVTVDAAIERAWITSMGRRSVAQQIAHLICELYTKMSIVGLVTRLRFEFPVKQEELADVLGLSLVHTNRMIQKLRAQALITWDSGIITIPDLDRLKEFADFDPIYLSMQKEPR